MKKLVIAAAVLGAFAGTAQAQSSVTLFGVLDTAVTHVSTSNHSATFEDNNGGLQSDRLGFQGVDDLGGGLKGAFWLEAGFAPSSGAGSATNSNNQATGAAAALAGSQGLTFNRRSTVSLIGSSWGEIRLGRDYTPTFLTEANGDPWGYNGLGDIQALGLDGQTSTAVRMSNGVAYFTPNTLGGFGLQATHAFGGNVSGAPTSSDGNYNALSVSYANGPIWVQVATSKTTYFQTAATGDVDVNNIGGSYDFGAAKLFAVYQDVKDNYTTSVQFKTWELGVTVPVGVGQIRASVQGGKGEFAANSATASEWGIGYVYNLSKRTALYASYAHGSNSGPVAILTNLQGDGAGAVAAGTSLSAESVGIRVAF